MRRDEWLEADGLGGFASGTVCGIRTRRYHALLLTATMPPSGRIVLVNGFDASVETTDGNHAISSQLYGPDIMHPDGAARISEFKSEPWPQWTYVLPDGTSIQQEIFVVHGASTVVLSWRLVNAATKATLNVTPFFSGRDYHSLHHENAGFQFHPEMNGPRLAWHPYPDLPGIIARHSGEYRHQPDWYRNFVYEQERERGLDFTEDLAAPGSFKFDLTTGEGVLIFAAESFADNETPERTATDLLADLRVKEQRRRTAFPTPLDRAAGAYLVKRGGGTTIVAGYPWFTDWGRDTFISLRGLCLATGRLDDTRDILLEWSNVVSEGMLPNLFPDQGGRPEYNSVDASLWYIVAVHDFLATTKSRGGMITQRQTKALHKAVDAILTGYSRGT
ncbi:MAG TPA: glycogen debranching enzyme N-terminal domain-containing protein, partial [Candidatus Binatia bacterium]